MCGQGEDFSFRQLDEISPIACAVAAHSACPQMIEPALLDLMINALEHGNLGVDHAEKSQWIASGDYTRKIEERLLLSNNKDKFVEMCVEKEGAATKVTITDMGGGFDWKKYLDQSIENNTQENGMGFAVIRMAPASLEYVSPGNKVIYTFE